MKLVVVIYGKRSRIPKARKIAAGFKDKKRLADINLSKLPIMTNLKKGGPAKISRPLEDIIKEII